MTKLKGTLLIILIVVLVVFALENTQPTPMLRLFKFELGQVPTFLLAYAGLVVGLIVGWLGHVLRVRKKRREAAALAASQEQKESQQRSQSQQAAE